MPLPLGGNVIRRDLGAELISASCGALHDSIQYALDHREEALQYAMQFARDLDPQLADKFVGMYVNERTLDYGKDGREAIVKLLDMGYEAGIIPHKPNVEFAGDAALSRRELAAETMPAVPEQKIPPGQNLLIDADDTLWENNIYFERAIADFITFLDHQTHTPDEVRAGAVGRGARDHSPARLWHAQLRQRAGRLLRTAVGRTGHAALHDQIKAIAYKIAEHPMEIMPEVPETLPTGAAPPLVHGHQGQYHRADRQAGAVAV